MILGTSQYSYIATNVRTPALIVLSPILRHSHPFPVTLYHDSSSTLSIPTPPFTPPPSPTITCTPLALPITICTIPPLLTLLSSQTHITSYIPDPPLEIASEPCPLLPSAKRTEILHRLRYPLVAAPKNLLSVRWHPLPCCLVLHDVKTTYLPQDATVAVLWRDIRVG